MRFAIRYGLLLAGLSLMLVAVGCGKKTDVPAEKTSIDIKGSDTMVNLMSALAETHEGESRQAGGRHGRQRHGDRRDAERNNGHLRVVARV